MISIPVISTLFGKKVPDQDDADRTRMAELHKLKRASDRLVATIDELLDDKERLRGHPK